MSLKPNLTIGLIIACIVVLYLRWKKRPNLPLPPGPKPLPIIGNLLDIPPKAAWLVYERWSKEFQSDILYLNAAGTNIVVLNTYEAVIELFEKRSLIHSSRTRMPMVNELMGWDFFLGLMPYGERWRSLRRVFHEVFNANAVKDYHSQQLKAVYRLLLRFIERPDPVTKHFGHLTTDVILSIAYGIEVLPDNDPWIALSEQALHNFLLALVPGTFWVDMFPWLQYVPSCLVSFKRKAKAWSKLTRSFLELPFEAVKEDCRSGKFTPSFSAAGLERLKHVSSSDEDEFAIRDAAASMYTAGLDATSATLSNLILAILKFPAVQSKAQAELDRVLNGSLPTFQDQDSLPYVTAVVLEALRWNTVVPLSFPHCSTADDVYDGYFIPRGTIVIPNVWAMFHDEQMYPDPSTFNPDRYLSDGKLNPVVRDPRTICFGFGRRICPGRYMAFPFVWITVASILATMNITKAIDEDGNTIEPLGEYDISIINTLKPFNCDIKPRSAHAESLIRSALLEEEK